MVDKSTPGLIEDVPSCALCGSENFQFMYEGKDRLHRSEHRFALVQCLGCKLVRLSPRPLQEVISDFYPDDEYYSYQQPVGITSSQASPEGMLGRLRDWIRSAVLGSLGYNVGTLDTAQRLLRPLLVPLFTRHATFGWNRRFPAFVKDGWVLDVGCGSGAFLSYMKAFGWNVAGVEINEQAARTAKDAFDIDVFIGNLSDAPFPAASFDHIHLSHVLEHVYDPVDFLTEIRSLLKPGGTVYIELPNLDSMSRRLTGKYWFPWEVPRHLFTFSSKNLSTTLARAGFQLDRIETKFEDQYEIPFRYQYEDRIGRKMLAGEKLPFVSRVRVLLTRLVVRGSGLVSRQSGDFLCCWGTNRNSFKVEVQ